jgi:hypothetical protein
MIAQLVEVLIGLVMVYLIFSTIASALVEVVEMLFQNRGKFLEQGIEEILVAVTGKRDTDDMKTFYESPFISSLFRDSYKAGAASLPSYIPAERFADAVLQLARDQQGTFAQFVTRMEQAIGTDVATNVDQVKAQCMRYFNESMERVSGWYQRYARWWLLALGFCIAAAGNVDTLQIMHTLSQDDSLREQVVEDATLQARTAAANDTAGTADGRRAKIEEQLQLVASLGLPIGWSASEMCRVFGHACPEAGTDGDGDDTPPTNFLVGVPFWSKVFGVLLTTFALSFGAPFWFDLLNQLVNVRSSLKPKPAESQEAAAPPRDQHTDTSPAPAGDAGAPGAPT